MNEKEIAPRPSHSFIHVHCLRGEGRRSANPQEEEEEEEGKNGELQEFLDAREERLLGHGPDDGVLLLAVLEEEDRGDAADAVAGGDVGALVRVELEAIELPRVRRRYVGDYGVDHPARPAPRRPEGHDHQLVAAPQHQRLP